MKILLDTSVLVASMVEVHPKHHQSLTWFKKVQTGKTGFTVCSHSLAECYAVLTKLPTIPRITPSLAIRLIEENIIKHAKLIYLTDKEYLSVIKQIAGLSLSGGIIYDALILKAAEKAKVDKLLTLNPRDFHRLMSDSTSSFILTP